jgi:hypothetical protein
MPLNGNEYLEWLASAKPLALFSLRSPSSGNKNFHTTTQRVIPGIPGQELKNELINGKINQ